MGAESMRSWRGINKRSVSLRLSKLREWSGDPHASASEYRNLGSKSERRLRYLAIRSVPERSKPDSYRHVFLRPIEEIFSLRGWSSRTASWDWRSRTETELLLRRCDGLRGRNVVSSSAGSQRSTNKRNGLGRRGWSLWARGRRRGFGLINRLRFPEAKGWASS